MTYLEFEQLLTPSEAADKLNLDPKTLARWAKGGVIDCITYPTGHRRYRQSVVAAIIDGTYVPPRDRVDTADEL